VKASDRTVLIALPIVALIAAFWFLVLAPKREEAAALDSDIAALQSEVSQAEQQAAFAEQARDDFPDDYEKVVSLGKAVPQDDDTASLFAQLSGVASSADVEFTSLELQSEGGEEAAAPAPAPADAAPTAEAPPEEGTPATTETAPPATESAAATLPNGASVGPANLPVMPYKLSFKGDFFHVADFVKGLDSGVSTADGKVAVDGRLLTIDGFSLAGDPDVGFPSLVADFAVTTYVTPETEGLTSGATPSGPAPVSDTSGDTTVVDQASAEVTP
jgi:Tfp pilus assembly protein PilO